jgi:hypothetical protein
MKQVDKIGVSRPAVGAVPHMLLEFSKFRFRFSVELEAIVIGRRDR